MSNEAIKAYTVGVTLDGYVFRRSDGYVWYPVGEVFEDWGTGSRAAADYWCIAMKESVVGSSGYYEGNFPTAITTAAQYDIQYRERASTDPANSDTILKPLQPIYWTGTASEGEGTTSELVYTHTVSSTLTAYVFRRSDQKVWYETLGVFETWGTDSRTASDYAVTMTESTVGASGYYLGDFPSSILTGVLYDIQYRSGATILTPLQAMEWIGTDDGTAALTALFNYALGKIGGGGIDLGNYRVVSINDDTPTAQKGLEIWPQIRKEVMTRKFWTSATKYADLGDEIDVTRAAWEYAFNLPTDYLGRAQQIDEVYYKSTKPKYQTFYDKEIVQGRLFTNLYSNEGGDSAYVKYVFNLTDVAKFDPHLYNAIATKWSSEMAGTLTADGGVRRRELLLEYEDLVLPVAEGEDAMTQGDSDKDDGEYSAISVRTE